MFLDWSPAATSAVVAIGGTLAGVGLTSRSERKRNEQARADDAERRRAEARKETADRRLLEYAACLDLGNRVSELHLQQALTARDRPAGSEPLTDSPELRKALQTFEAQRVRAILVGSATVRKRLATYDASVIRDNAASRLGTDPLDDGTDDALLDAMRSDIDLAADGPQSDASAPRPPK